MKGETVQLSYSSFSNISFKGTIDTNVPREEWEEMTFKERDEVVTDCLFDLVEIWEDE